MLQQVLERAKRRPTYDVTDEDAFATLAGPDVGIKVGPGESAAALRAGGTPDVTRTLARLAELRH